MPYFNGRNAAGYRKALRDFFSAHPEYKVVHGHVGSCAHIYLKVAKEYGCYTILHSHNTRKKLSVKQILFRIFTIRARHLCKCDTDGAGEAAGDYLFGKNITADKNRYTILKNAIDTEKFLYQESLRRKKREELGVKDAFLIGHVGRFDYQKNHEFLIEIFREYLKKDEKAILLLVGDGENKKYLESIIEAENLSKNVQFLGARDDINRLLQAMDVFVFPSRYEGLGVALIEAQLSGLPCLASSTIPREVEVSDNIRFLNIDDSPTVWSDTIYNVVNKKDNVRNSPLKMVRSRGYDMTECITGLEQFYDQLYRKKLINR